MMKPNDEIEEFDWAKEFPQLCDEDGNFEGFDVVMGNPPYLDSEYMVKNMPKIREYITQNYETAKGNWDLFIPFIELSFRLLKEKGEFSYIAPNKLLSSDYARTCRNFLLSNQLNTIRDYSRKNVFTEADVYPVVIAATKNAYQNDDLVRFETMADLETAENSNQIERAEINEHELDFYFTEKQKLNIIKKINERKPLSEFITHISDASTVAEAYRLKEKMKNRIPKRKPYKKIINTGTIDPYTSLWKIKNMRYIKQTYATPVITDEELKKLSKRRFEQAGSEKIIVAGMSKQIEAVYDKGEFLAAKSTSIILHNDTNFLKFVLGVLNSKLMSFYVSTVFHSNKMAGGYINISPGLLRTIPLADYDKKIVALVEQILEMKQSEPTADTQKYQHQIDKLVCKLYGLNEKEIAIIEGE